MTAASELPDLDTCAAEPIHIPGSIQPHGVLLAVTEPDHVVVHVSENVHQILGVAAGDTIGRPLGDALGAEPAAAVRRAVAAFSDLRERNPLELEIVVAGTARPFDAILHRQAEGGLLLVELEIADGPRPFSFPNTYQAVRGAVERLNRASTLAELFQTTASAVRRLTGFDRVMVYRYDHLWNGEVVAEDKREDLNTFLGQHYPASDIPAQARALYEKNWIRLIADVQYTPSPITPVLTPGANTPLDLTHSTLRSVSPVHVEYLTNMGVHASMSISLLREGRLWGLIACHHYAGPHLPPYGTRAAAEFLGSTLSLRLVDRFEDEQLLGRLAAQRVLAKLTAATLDVSDPLPAALLGAPDLLDLIPGDGVVVSTAGEYRTRGLVPPDEITQQIAEWARIEPADVVSSEFLGDDLPEVAVDPATASGTLVVKLPDNGFLAWFRAEQIRSVDWGGDPHNKAIAAAEDGSIRLSPRKSFELWRETVRGRSQPWERHELEVAAELRRHTVDALYQRAQNDLRLAEVLQRSLLPAMPQLPGWVLSAYYEPAAGGRIGGDWYDAMPLDGSRLAVVLGDVAGHGITAAGTMAQLRNALRAFLFEGHGPGEALRRLNAFVSGVLPGAFATVSISLLELDTGHVVSSTAGHPLPFVQVRGARPSAPDIAISPPMGVHRAVFRESEWTLEPGARLILFSDGLIERRTEDLHVSRERLAAAIAANVPGGAQGLWRAMRGGPASDDATVLLVERP